MRSMASKSTSAETGALLDALYNATRAVRERLGVELDRQGLTVPMFWTLHHVAEDGPMNLRQVASACWVTSSNVSTLVEDLVHSGLVRRERAEQDRRELVLSVTNRGKSLHAEVWRRVGAIFAEGVRDLPASELSTSARVLGRLAEVGHQRALPRVVVAR